METDEKPVRKFNFAAKANRLILGVVGVALVLGLGTGYVLASKSSSSGGIISPADLTNSQPKSAQQDNRTFRDFAEGKITAKPASKNPNDYGEGTHLLIRDVGVPVALTSSVVDLSQYEGKKVKVYGETQKAVSAGWLMDVGKVEVEQ